MKLEWSVHATQDRDRIFDYIEQDSPRAAIAVDDQISLEVNKLIHHPHIGRPGRIEGTRELVIARTPYIAAYKADDQVVRILRILHGAQRWPTTASDLD